MNQGKQPVTVGLFFSLGHSSVVFLLSVAVIFSTSFVQEHLSASEAVGSLVGTTVSAVFLFVIGAINAIVFFDLYKQWHSLKDGNPIPVRLTCIPKDINSIHYTE